MRDHPSPVGITEDPDVLFQRMRIRVTPVADGRANSAVVVQGNLNAGGLRLRVQAAGSDAAAAAELVHTRLRSRLNRLTAACYQGVPGDGPHAWLPPRDFSFGTNKPSRSAVRPEIRRRKVVGLRQETVDDAAFFMDAMDYDFHLFSCVDTGQDSVVYRCGPTGYKVAPLSLKNGLPQRRAIPITVSPRPAPCLTEQQAAAQLRDTEMPFVFFSDAGADRPSGIVLYQRYDGHYGLLEPSWRMSRVIDGPVNRAADRAVLVGVSG